MRFIVLSLMLLMGGTAADAASAEPPQSGTVPAAAVRDAGQPASGAEAISTLPASTEDVPAASAATAKPPVQEKPAPPPPPTLHVDIDLGKQRMVVTERGERRHTWPISSGREGYRTPTGTFSPTWMSRMWYSRQYDDAPMPHSVFFNGGIAVHGTQHTRMLGRPASHGCIRLAPANAATLYAMVASHGKSMTRIKVFGTPKDEPPVAASRQRWDDRYVGEGYAARRAQDYYPPARYLPPRRYAYDGYRRGNGYAYSPRYVYRGDLPPYGYRPARPLYRPYGNSRRYIYLD